ncbi:hypothetical protein C7B02_27010 [Escherichia coli]|nr:hypothetical protein C7B02_27010 [Escherichia coli]
MVNFSATFSIALIFIYFSSVLKTGDPKGFQSSNLCASAKQSRGYQMVAPFFFLFLVYTWYTNWYI